MVAYLFILASLTGSGPSEAEHIVETGRGFLRQVGAPEPLSLIGLEQIHGPGLPTWHERFIDARASRYEFFLSPDGRIRSARRSGESARTNSNSPAPTQAALDHRLATILKPVLGRHEVGPATYLVNQRNEVSAWVPLRAAGRPVFNQLGYSISFQGGSGQFRSFDGPFQEPVSEVNAKAPRIQIQEAANLASS